MLRQLDPGSRPIIAFSRQVIAINSLWLLIWNRLVANGAILPGERRDDE
jgi:hypothetical protein